MIPDFQTIMLPILEILSDGKEYEFKELVQRVSDKYNLTDEERNELVPSGVFSRISDRVGWARTYLKKANLLVQPRRAFVKISPQGVELLKTKPKRIDKKFLDSIKEFREWKESYQKKVSLEIDTNRDVIENLKTPYELIKISFNQVNTELSSELLEKVKSCSPKFFEGLVVRLLVKMGYGGSIEEAGSATQLTNDGGIDGVIKEDKLGLDQIFIQAKRWDTQSVGRPDLQSFVGALAGKHASKGVFITTSHFAPSALEYVKTISQKIILIDGEKLTEYMIEHNIGVNTYDTFELKKIDNDYFEEY